MHPSLLSSLEFVLYNIPVVYYPVDLEGSKGVTPSSLINFESILWQHSISFRTLDSLREPLPYIALTALISFTFY